MQLPQGAPATLGEAFAHIGAVDTPNLLDMKVMVLVEAAAMELYYTTAAAAQDPAVRVLLERNGREEMLHSQRVALAIKALTGEDFAPPLAADNPYLQDGSAPMAPITREALTKLAEGEFDGEALYEKWAAGMDNPEVAERFRANGKEETDHGNRLMAAVALLPA